MSVNKKKAVAKSIATAQPADDSGKIRRYGHKFPAGTNDLTIELICFHGAKIDPTRTGLPKEEHFKNVVKILWPVGVQGRLGFFWHPWACDMLDACVTNNRVGFAGCASSGKSEFMAIWSLVNWLAAPLDTLVLVTSTTIRDAQKRVWGAIQKYYQAIPEQYWPGKMATSPSPSIRARDAVGKLHDQAGVFLIPSEAKKSAEATGKMRGMKNRRVFLVADELAELSDALVDTAMSNLTANDYFHMVAASNPNSYFDPFGKYVQPIDGWKSIHVDSGSWKTVHRGVCLHFDALKSPNWTAGEDVWPIMKRQKIQDALDLMNPNSVLFWRDYRGFWAMEGADDAIYTESEILKFNGTVSSKFTGTTTRIAALDPSFTKGGDRTVLYLGTVGKEGDNQLLEFDKHICIEEDVTNLTESRSFQIAEKIKDILNKEGVDYRNFGTDTTGAGMPFAEILARTFQTNRFLHVNFGGSASEDPVSTSDETLAKEKYVNRVSELWFRGAELLRSNKLRGMSPELCKELSSRKYLTMKSSSMKLQVESKGIYKSRQGKSPDIADSAVVLIEVAYQRFHLKGSWRPASTNDEWREFWKKRDVTAQAGRFIRQ